MDAKLSPTKSPVKKSSSSPSKSSPSKSAPADPNLRLHVNSICAKDTKLALTGLLTLRSNSVIHPKVQISTSAEGTELGRFSIISEKCIVRETTRIGDFVLIEAGCEVFAKEIGDGTTLESGVVLGDRCVIGKNCRIGAGETVGADEIIPDGMVIFGNGRRRIDKSDQVAPPRSMLTVEIAIENARETDCMVTSESSKSKSSMANTMTMYNCSSSCCYSYI
jgi:dynactin 6